MRKSWHLARQQGRGDEDKNECYLGNVAGKNEDLYLLAWGSDEQGAIMIYRGLHPSGEMHDAHQQTLHYSHSTD